MKLLCDDRIGEENRLLEINCGDSVRNVEYSILLVMSELSTVQYDRTLGL